MITFLAFFLCLVLQFMELHCDDNETEPLTISTDEGSDVVIPCGLSGEVEWKIKGTSCSFDGEMPPDYEHLGYAGILIPEVNLDLDGCTFQCVNTGRVEGMITYISGM